MTNNHIKFYILIFILLLLRSFSSQPFILDFDVIGSFFMGFNLYSIQINERLIIHFPFHFLHLDAIISVLSSYILVQEIKYKNNLNKSLIYLASLALISQLFLAITIWRPRYFSLNWFYNLSGNLFYSLIISLIAIYFYRLIKTKFLAIFTFILIFLVQVYIPHFDLTIPIFASLFYIFKDANSKKQAKVVFLFSILIFLFWELNPLIAMIFVSNTLVYLGINLSPLILRVLAGIFIYKYGLIEQKDESSSKNKTYLLLLLYPLHFLFVYLINFLFISSNL